MFKAYLFSLALPFVFVYFHFLFGVIVSHLACGISVHKSISLSLATILAFTRTHLVSFCALEATFTFIFSVHGAWNSSHLFFWFVFAFFNLVLLLFCSILVVACMDYSYCLFLCMRTTTNVKITCISLYMSILPYNHMFWICEPLWSAIRY